MCTPCSTKTKRIIVNDEYTQVVDDNGKNVDTPLPFSWLAIDDSIPSPGHFLKG